jgi:photosynthetic reaction center cytochrome c subunit
MSARLTSAGVALLAVITLLAGCERPPVDTVQRGYRGTGMELVYNPRTEARVAAANQAPAVTEPASGDAGPKARDIYKNVPQLGHLGVAEFTRYMAAITEWVAPEQGCNYCHDPANMGDDSKYTKVVSRRMIEMTQHINADWKPHVAETGVTCYTCHRGKAVPLQVWFKPEPQPGANFIGDRAGQNAPMKMVGKSSLTYDPYSLYLLGDQTIGIGASTALPTGHVASILHTEQTYGLMMHMSDGLGVNCTYCHNTRNFKTWEGSPPQRTTAWQGIRMSRELNNDYLVPLTKSFPANRLGPLGDVAKVNCATCHQGVYKPLYGAPMAKNYPALTVSASTPAKAAADGLPPPMAEATRSVLYFGVGSATLEGEQAKGLTLLIATLVSQPAAKASISGYHSASGELASNQQLAKDRAVKVRDSIVAAGIAPTRVALDKPLQAEANLSGEDPAARRVEVSVK